MYIVSFVINIIAMGIDTKKSINKNNGQVSVLLVVVDGLRPDAVTEKNCPTLYLLAKEGVWAENAFTLNPSITLPSFLSMFYSSDASEHGVILNSWDGFSCKKASLMQQLKKHGRTSTFINSWPIFNRFRTQFKEYIFIGEGAFNLQDDLLVAESAERYIQMDGLDLLVVYFGGVDIVGHKYGWMSQEYLNQVGVVDEALNSILKKAHQDCTTFVVSDHGGYGNNHNDTSDKLIMRTTWLVHGAKIRRGHILEKEITHLDLAPTIVEMFGVESDSLWAGESVASEIRIIL